MKKAKLKTYSFGCKDCEKFQKIGYEQGKKESLLLRNKEREELEHWREYGRKKSSASSLNELMELNEKQKNIILDMKMPSQYGVFEELFVDGRSYKLGLEHGAKQERIATLEKAKNTLTRIKKEVDKAKWKDCGNILGEFEDWLSQQLKEAKGK